MFVNVVVVVVRFSLNFIFIFRATSIETFAQQEPALETHLKNLSSGLSKFLERHTEIYEKDMQKIGELFAKLHNAAEVDSTTPGNREMANAMMKISASYNAIAQLYKTKVKRKN